MSGFKDLTGQRFGRLLVAERAENTRTKGGTSIVMWKCICDCGNNAIVNARALVSDNTKSCGCYKKEITSKRIKKDIIGKRYGKLIVIEYYGIKQYNSTEQLLYKCQCDCGNKTIVAGMSLRNGHTTSCGCYQKSIASKSCFKNIIGQKFNNLTVIKRHSENKNKRAQWVCQCDCGNIHIVSGKDLRNGHIKSCGCIKSSGEQKILNWLIDNNIIHKHEYRFNDCVNLMPLPFDFAVFNEHNKLLFLIEYDGEQHFKPIRFNGIPIELAENNFKQTKINDEIKNIYCINNNIMLIRIPYLDFDNIDSILEQNIKSQNIKHSA